MTQILKYPFSDSAETLLKTSLKAENPIVFPTETLYALGGNALSETFCQRVNQIKKRPSDKALPVLITPELLQQWACIDFPEAWELIENFWPGPLTLIVRASSCVPSHLGGANRTIAVRHSSSTIVQALLDLGQCPLIGTSANLSGFPATHSVSQAQSQLQQEVSIYIEGKLRSSSLPSTILNCTSLPFRIEREGVLRQEELRRVGVDV